MVGVTAVYRYVLSDDQKDSMRELGNGIRSSAEEVMDSVSPLVSKGPTRKEEQAAADENRARTAAQWEALGY